MAAALLALGAGAVASGAERGARPSAHVWRLEGERLAAPPAAPLRAWPVGSLVKPFIVEAWARARPGRSAPRLVCGSESRCWLGSGHGAVDLPRALALSCNAYFRGLASEVPLDLLKVVLAEHGFIIPANLEVDGLLGLDAAADVPVIEPGALLRAYVRLVREPWLSGEALRREVLLGLREAAVDGTARGLAHRGYWAKTGTVAAVDGRALGTSGWALALDDTAWAVLALLPDGTGRQAAQALATEIAVRRPWSVQPSGSPARPVPAARGAAAHRVLAPSQTRPPDRVGIVLLSALRPRSIVISNRDDHPLASSYGYLGPGGSQSLRGGDWVADGLWEIAAGGTRLRRRVKGALSCRAFPAGTLRLLASLAPEEYVAGIIHAELGRSDHPLALELGAAALRFLASGPFHADSDVCDLTHCAWFIGRGPYPEWPAPDRVVFRRPLGAPADPGLGALNEPRWAEIQARALEPGPDRWSSHCGGRPLSPHAVWATGDERTTPCPRHDRSHSRPWERRYSAGDLSRVFGGAVSAIEVRSVGGVWRLRVDGRDLLYDDAHRRFARVLGWGAFPSPATRFVRTEDGFRAEGVGLGHRVGLCLAE